MRRRRLFWVLYPSFLLVILVAVTVSSISAARVCKDIYRSRTAQDLATRAAMLASELRVRGLLANSGQTDTRCKELGIETATRFTVILPDGRVIGDSQAEPASMENHGGRSEVIPALVGRRGKAVRTSRTVGREMMYVAIPVRDSGEVVAVARAAIDVSTISHSLRSIYLRAALAGILVLVLGALLDLIISRRLSRQLEFLSQAAKRIARGKRGHGLPSFKIDEVDTLARSMSSMGHQIEQHIQSVARERNERAAILSSMSEGVIAVDAHERIIHLNKAAERILQVDFALVRGKLIHEAIRNSDLQNLVHGTLHSAGPSRGETVIAGPPLRHLTMEGSLLHSGEGDTIGCLVVLNEVTDLRRLETIRRDFVANVSHELRTPVTAIRGAVDALRADAPEAASPSQRFLDMIDRQSQRIEAIISDLLALSRMEREEDRAGIDLVESAIEPVLADAVTTCEIAAHRKEVTVELVVAPDARARINPALIEQAVVNLLANAIEACDAGSRVTIQASIAPPDDGGGRGSLVISVEDQGCGIEARHLDRIFERFYRVDRSRQRRRPSDGAPSPSGTGLGLAIVKHVAALHGGTVRVASRPGEGSRFTIVIPIHRDTDPDPEIGGPGQK